ncbi:Lymphokine-activated killer T-cell-originated protein kinase [Cyphomyrmex costatus]|uniref:Lymphokine-activated killer T-cell-originated protein kinase n=1 Tax=Cyphomyrmex costatus TaxID=456900 RepID=A0A151IHG1_9HYME|nr:Lymphokine-activated killer T-cell-originated protein kinase [Cyphomyrmex costatus]
MNKVDNFYCPLLGVVVYKFERRSSTDSKILTPWAVKILQNKWSDTSIEEHLYFEAEVLRQLDHSNVVGFKAFVKGEDGQPCLAMEALDTSLGHKIEERRKKYLGKKPFSANDIIIVGFETIKGLEYLHHNAHILHGDIKSWNILVTNDLNTIKLCDFGNSLPLTESLEQDTSTCNYIYTGTWPWNPPEVIFENRPAVTSAADIWSYGLVLWEMLTLSTPHLENISVDSSSSDEFASINTRRQKWTRNCKFGTRPAISNGLGEDYQKVLEIFFACTTNCYLLRPSAKALVNSYEHFADVDKIVR